MKFGYRWILLLGLTVYPITTCLGTGDDIVARIETIVKNKSSDKSTVSFLTQALKNPDNDVSVRERAAWALGELQANSAVPALIEAAQHKGLLIRSAALDSLIRLRTRNALPVLTEMAQSDPILSLRQRATLALGLLQSDKAIPALIKLSSDKTAEVQGAAALAMAATHSKKNDFSEVLKEMAGDDDPYVKRRAQLGLEIVQRKTSSIRQHLSSEDADVRLFAALYFRNHGEQRDVKILSEAAGGEAQDDVRYEMNKAAATIKKRLAEAKARQKKAAQEASQKTSINSAKTGQ